jgi:hypothetical protein
MGQTMARLGFVCILGLNYVLNFGTGVAVSIVLRDMHFLIARYLPLI